MRDQYLFNLARLCGLHEPAIGALALADFAVYIDSIDEWLKWELAPKRVVI